MKKVDTGGFEFSRIRDENMYFVDKSLLIKDILDTNPGGVYLYTRPRRFGKTTNLTMLDAFFNIEYEGNTWFDGLAISEYQHYERFKNKFPVIRVDLKDLTPGLGAADYGLFISMMGKALRKTYRRFRYLLDSENLIEEDKAVIRSVLSGKADESTLITAISELCIFLKDHHGVMPVVLIDEYDRAITDTFDSDLQQKIISFMSGFFSSTLKSNNNMQMAYVTGVMQIAKADFFSGLNNPTVNTTFSTESDERFGFTEGEIRDILSYYGHPEKFEELRDWYDGYRFGDVEVYNPFSVMMCIQRGFKPDSYWRDSSRNTPVRWMLDRTGSIGWQAMADLINGGTIRSELHQTMSYDELRLSDPDDLLSLMVMTGYLNAVPVGDGVYELSIPNREVMGIVDSLLSGGRRIGSDLFDSFNRAVLEGDAKAMETTLQSVLADGSYFSLRDESSYENIVLTMMHGILRGYRISSQQESGNGRLDLVLEPRDEGTVPIIIELKVSDSESDLERDAEGAVAQIHDRKYYLGMRGDVILIGLAFWGKVVRGRVERISLRGRRYRSESRSPNRSLIESASGRSTVNSGLTSMQSMNEAAKSG